MAMVGIFTGLNISATGMRAQRVRQNVIASNLANAETTRTEDGGPYRKQFVVLEADPRESNHRFVFQPPMMEGVTTHQRHMGIPDKNRLIDPEYIGSGVNVAAIEQDQSPFRSVFDPNHPDADERGYVMMPNISVIQEMTDMITATRAYEANVSAFQATKGMIQKALEL